MCRVLSQGCRVQSTPTFTCVGHTVMPYPPTLNNTFETRDLWSVSLKYLLKRHSFSLDACCDSPSGLMLSLIRWAFCKSLCSGEVCRTLFRGRQSPRLERPQRGSVEDIDSTVNTQANACEVVLVSRFACAWPMLKTIITPQALGLTSALMIITPRSWHAGQERHAHRRDVHTVGAGKDSRQPEAALHHWKP